MNKLSFILIFLLSICIQQIAKAESYCERRKLGWHFYCNKNEEEKKATNIPETKEEAAAQLAELKQELEDTKALAVMNPTTKNIKDYIILQRTVLDNSSKFASVWQKAIWQNPELDYTVKKPMSIVGNEVLNQIKSEDEARIFARLKDRYGIFFFFRSDCVYCHKFSPILKRYSEINGIEVMPVSMDSGALPEWNKFVTNSGEAAKFGMDGKPVPAIIMFDSKTQKVVPVGFGLMTMDVMSQRIVALVKQNEGIAE